MKIWREIKWFFRQVSRSFAYAKHAWGGYDWDYSYSIKMFQYSLERLADKLDSNSAYRTGAKSRAIRCKMIAKLMERVNEDYYATSYVGVLERIYGKVELVVEDIGDGEYKYKGFKWEKAIDDKHNDEINKFSDELYQLGIEKQKRAEILLWKLVEHNIKYFWD
jgi:hypothetical protein